MTTTAVTSPVTPDTGPPDHPGVKVVPLSGDIKSDASLIELFVSVPGNKVKFYTHQGNAYAVFIRLNYKP